MKDVDMDRTYANVYTSGHLQENNHDLHLLKQHLQDLLDTSSQDNRIMNIGSGPCEVVAAFMEVAAPYVKEVVLVEPSEAFCEQYRQQGWYLDKPNRVTIICKTLEQVMDEESLGSGTFDAIWCCRMMYYWRLSEFPKILAYLTELLKADVSTLAVILGNHNDPCFTYYRKLHEGYRHDSVFLDAVKGSGCPYRVSTNQATFVLAEKNARSLMTMLFEYDVMRLPDYYNAGDRDLSRDEKRKLDKTVGDFIKQHVTYDAEKMVYHILLDTYLIKKPSKC